MVQKPPATAGEPRAPSAHVALGVRDVIVAQLGVAPERVRPETYLIDLDADPLDLIEIVLGLESTFGVQLSTVSPARLRTVRDAVLLVERHLSARG